MASYYPPVSFHFAVEFVGLSDKADTRFTEVGGLAVEMGSEEVPEGGENRFVQKYPTRAKYPELVLKRGLLKSSAVWSWIRDCIVDYKIELRNIGSLADDKQLLLDASSNPYAVESMQFAYQYFTVDKN